MNLTSETIHNLGIVGCALSAIVSSACAVYAAYATRPVPPKQPAPAPGPTLAELVEAERQREEAWAAARALGRAVREERKAGAPTIVAPRYHAPREGSRSRVRARSRSEDT